MSNIDCDAERCVHNREGQCNAAIVHVRGGATTDYAQIHCGTYAYIRSAPHKLNGFLFETGPDMSPPLGQGGAVRIACGAGKCRFFSDYQCTADSIHVRDPDYTQRRCAECGTFQPE